MRFYILVNTKSGDGSGAKILERIAQLVQVGLIDGEAEAIDFSNLTEQLQTSLNYDRVLIAGGDGTVSSVLRCFVTDPLREQFSSETDFAIGILPQGTGNDLARELGVAKPFFQPKIAEIIRSYSNAKIIPLDIWKADFGSTSISNITFCNYLSIGFDGEVVSIFHQNRYRTDLLSSAGRVGNRLRYGLISMRSRDYSISLENIKIVVGSQQWEPPNRCKAIIFSNIRSVMGVGALNTVADFSDRKFELIIMRSLRDYLRALLAPYLPINFPPVAGQCQSIQITGLPNDLPLQIDGEPFNNIDTAEIRISHLGQLPILRKA